MDSGATDSAHGEMLNLSVPSFAICRGKVTMVLSLLGLLCADELDSYRI